jgi:predicted nucleic acid-binding protein
LNNPFVDTNVIIRLVTGDDPAKQTASRELFNRVEAGELSLEAPDTVIADAVYVLSSRAIYNLSRTHIREVLSALLRLPNFRVENRSTLLYALEIYDETSLDFSDAFIAATMARGRSTVLYSYDTGLDKLPLIDRLVP